LCRTKGPYRAPRPAICAELKVRTVHRRCHSMVKIFAILAEIQQERQRTCNAELRRAGTTIVGVEKQLSITYSVSVFVATGFLHEMRTHHIVICALSSSTKIFPQHLTNGTIFRKQFLDTKCVVFFYNVSLKHFSV